MVIKKVVQMVRSASKMNFKLGYRDVTLSNGDLRHKLNEKRVVNQLARQIIKTNNKNGNTIINLHKPQYETTRICKRKRVRKQRVVAAAYEDDKMEVDISYENELASVNPCGQNEYKVIVKNVSLDITINGIYKMFYNFGKVVDVCIDGHGKAEVIFDNAEDAMRASKAVENRELSKNGLQLELISISSNRA